MADIVLINFSKCCRLCLSSTTDNLKSVFGETTEDMPLQQKITDLLGVEIMANDKLSTLVCTSCIEKIDSWQFFKTSCFQNQAKLEQWLNISNNNITETSEIENIPIKAEPLDQEVSDIVNCVEITIKNELVEEEYDDLPPLLTPQRSEETGHMEVSVHTPSSQNCSNDDEDSRRCSLCAKVFCSIGNLRRHQKNIHGIKNNICFAESGGGRSVSANKGEISYTSIILQPMCENKSTTKLEETSATKQLLTQQNSTKKNGSIDNCFYCCPECDDMFSSTEWEKHRNTHTMKTCNECGKVFQFESELDQHKSVHQNLRRSSRPRTKPSFKNTVMSSLLGRSDTSMMCQICDKTFTSKTELRKHKQTHETMPVLESAIITDEDKNGKKFCCKLCNKQYDRRESLKAHNTKIHSENRSPKKSKSPKKEATYHTCKICFKSFSQKASLKKHIKSHGNKNKSSEITNSKKTPKKVWCDVCHYAFDSVTDLQKHKAKGHSSNDEDMPVLFDERINKVDVKKYKEQAHISKISKKKQKPLRCKYCKITFANHNQLSSHIKNEHVEDFKPKQSKDNEMFTCELCKKSFTSMAGLYSHQGWHTREKYNNSDRAQQSSDKFIKKVPPKSKSKAAHFKCSTCAAVLGSEKALKDHVIAKHKEVTTSVYPVRCTMCNLDFSSKKEYEQHKSLHAVTDDPSKVFRCSHCGFVFNQFDTLKVHIAQMHQTSVLKCSLCDRVFEKQTSLDIHLKVHEKQRTVTEDKLAMKSGSHKLRNVPLYFCSICNKRFDIPKDLKTHTIQEHPF